MPIVELSEDDFDSFIEGSTLPVLVDFWAAWCHPCKMMLPILTEVASDYAESIVVAKVDVDAFPSLASRFAVTSIPSMKVFVAGEVVKGFEGAAPKRVLLNELQEFLDA